MEKFYHVLSWIFGVLLVLSGLVLMVDSIWGGLVLVGCAGLVLPPVRRFVYARTGYQMPLWARALSVLVVFGAAGMVAEEDKRRSELREVEREAEQQREEAVEAREAARQEFSDNRSSILAELRSALESGDFETVVERADEYLVAEDEALTAIYQDAQAGIQAAADRERTAALLRELDEVDEDDIASLHGIYEELYQLNPDQYEYQVEMVSLASQLEQQRADEAAAAARRERIEAQFSGWNGAHHGLEKHIKDRLHDPGSYDHDETRYVDRGDFLVVQTQFRAANAFGAQRINSVRARVDLDGNILEVMDWN